MTAPSTFELFVQAAWFAAFMAAPVAIYFLAVGFARAWGWLRGWLRGYLPGGFERDWRSTR